jgi:hypothetical protein
VCFVYQGVDTARKIQALKQVVVGGLDYLGKATIIGMCFSQRSAAVENLERAGFSDRLDGFLSRVQNMLDSHYRKEYPNNPVPQVQAVTGRRYVKVIRTVQGSGSVYCFIDRGNGDVLKPASYAAPAKHARSNIYSDDYGLSGVGPYGASYLR